MTVVTPASVSDVAPSAMFVLPIVSELFVNPAFGMVSAAVNAPVPLP